MLSKDIFTKQLLLNWIIRILFFSSLSALLPTLPNYLNDIGGNNSQIGLVMSAFALGVLLFRPVIGKKLDTLGRKLILILGIVIFVIAPVMYLFIHSIVTLMPIRIFHGLGLAAFGTASITLITDAAPVEHRGTVISYTGMVNTIAFAFGPIMGSFIGDKWGYSVLFQFVAALAFLSLIFSFYLQETFREHDNPVRINYLQAVKQRKVLVPSVMILLIGLIHGGVMFYIPIFLKQHLTINIGLFFAIYGTATFVIRLLIGPVSDKWGQGPFLVLSLLSLSAGVFILSRAASVLPMFLAATLYGFGFGAHQPTLTALVANYTSEETRGKIFSFYYGGFDLGISLAGLVLGTVAEWYGIGPMFVVCAGLALLSLTIFALTIENSVLGSLRYASTLKRAGKENFICDQYMEVTPEQAEEYFRNDKSS